MHDYNIIFKMGLVKFIKIQSGYVSFFPRLTKTIYREKQG